MKTNRTGNKGVRRALAPRRQFGALPWRLGDGVEILLASSRGSRRWIIPKGWPMKGRKPHAAAKREAMEEAGLVGRIDKRKIGSFHYEKSLKNGSLALCRVDVFPLSVERQRKRWREQAERVTRWFPYDVAAEEVREVELKRLIVAFGQAIGVSSIQI